jgi:hypothetical protein|uniref:Uncharacterized protein n=1 Tax=Myoviridae sp. ctbwh6 TaxID=2827611 RepID=A0A8S5LI23_9CAUD|nr:MAG TPA: hypothetical protein [Myoviridae sp. ctbwh6]
MLITFTVKGQKITHDLKDTLVANSSGIVQAIFALDESWTGYDVVAVFKNSACQKGKPVRIENGVAFDIPPETLKPGKLYVSAVGFAESTVKKTTLGWDIQQAITVAKSGAGGDCDLLREWAQGAIPDERVATDEEVGGMLDDVFGKQVQPNPGGDDGDKVVDEDDIATDEEVNDMLDNVFSNTPQQP